MVNRKILAGVAVVCLAGGWLVFRAARSEESVIKGRLEEMRKVAELDAREGTIPAAGNSRTFGTFFSEDFTCSEPELPLPVRQRQDLEGLMFQARSRLDGIDLAFKDVSVHVAPDGETALMSLAARITLDHSGEREVSWKELELDWVRTPEGWLIASAKSLQAIRMP
jgi:ketosteroid isomerase-like protein